MKDVYQRLLPRKSLCLLNRMRLDWKATFITFLLSIDESFIIRIRGNLSFASYLSHFLIISENSITPHKYRFRLFITIIVIIDSSKRPRVLSRKESLIYLFDSFLLLFFPFLLANYAVNGLGCVIIVLEILSIHFTKSLFWWNESVLHHIALIIY